MKRAYIKKIEQLESHLAQFSLSEVVFQIGGQNKDGKEVETVVIANGEVMDIDEFNTKYPNFKPSGISIVVGEWDES